MSNLLRKIGTMSMALMMLLTTMAFPAFAEGEPETFTMLLVSSGTSTAELDKVRDKINDILVPELNARVEFVTVSIPDHTQKIGMMLASGDKLDIFESFRSFSNYQNNGYLLALDDYFDACPETIDMLGGYVNMGKVGDHIYGLPSMKDIAAGKCYVFRKDIIDEIGVNLDDVKNFDDLEGVLRKIKDAHPEMIPLVGDANTNPVMTAYGYINLNDQCYMDPLSDGFGVLMNPTKDTTVRNHYASEEFAKVVDYAWRWAQDGLIDYDDLSTPYELISAGMAVGCGYSYTPKAAIEASGNTNHEMVAWSFMGEKALATTTNDWSWCINANCANPELAMKVLNAFFTNKEIMNLLAWGIEGEHYAFADEANGVITYPEGVDSGSVSYYQWTKFTFQNNFLQYVMEGTSPTQWSEMQEFNNTADLSLALGFVYDPSELSTQIAACTNVLNEYAFGLLNGQLDPATELPAFIDKLEASGINDIVAAKQAQLDAFLGK